MTMERTVIVVFLTFNPFYYVLQHGSLWNFPSIYFMNEDKRMLTEKRNIFLFDLYAHAAVIR